MIIGILKSIREVFPEIDLREFSALRSLCDDTYSITIEVNGAKYVSAFEGKEFKIEVNAGVKASEIKEDEIYSCTLLDEAHTIRDMSIRLYGRWLKDVQDVNKIPFEKDFYKIFNELKSYQENKIAKEKFENNYYKDNKSENIYEKLND